MTNVKNPFRFSRRSISERLADLHPGQIFRRVRRDRHRETGMDGPHREVRQGLAREEWEKGVERACRGLGPRFGSHLLHGLQKVTI